MINRIDIKIYNYYGKGSICYINIKIFEECVNIVWGELSYMYEKIAIKLTRGISKHTNRTDIELTKIKFGIEVLIINISKFLLIITISYFLKIIPLTLILFISFGLIRRSAFGLHAKNSIVCTIISTSYFIGGAYISIYYPLEMKIMVLIFLIQIGLFMKYAPSDTESRPLVGKKLRSKLKRDTIVTVLILLAIALIVNNGTISMLITLGATMECISILPITYKILKRRYNNYEQYK
ncbi:putative agrB-like protein [Gottschalkia acidurici 9a]|uniref:Putative AgrB-like protein n=1 Tax=Gottschalkia acidurici (strain ATCC 7906 / DSM 604 / BCRC 14475 / CIP 104303 / KCTC 5404 / NCIMB 10678 / 9a) TaxID=1128398 RepID=K0AZT0_GOTA9|nr:accessory gene regulator B family protein [Gottschalkia acidurici]AFS77861.1 putative agrB-like protein [Gottschalkia acidurici 9a]